MDLILGFFRMKVTKWDESNKVKRASETTKDYLKTDFGWDLLTVAPLQLINPYFMYVKLIRLYRNWYYLTKPFWFQFVR